MKIENGKLVLEQRSCYACLPGQPGKAAGKKTCPACKGTRRGPRGGRNKCGCYDGTVPDFVNTVPCHQCHGTLMLAETRYDSAPDEVWESLKFTIDRNPQARFGFNEAYLGHGYVYTAQDYGRAWAMTDDAVIADVKAHKSHQACKFTKEDLTVCKEICIIVTRQGYKVLAVYEDTNIADQEKKTANEVAQMFDPVGLAVAEATVARGG